MQDNNSTPTDPIKQILDELSSSEENNSTFEAEFVFGDASGAEAFDFDDSDTVDDAPSTENLSSDESSKSEDEPVELPAPEKVNTENKKEATESSSNAPRIFTTYVPRFTDVSETYRMADKPRVNQAKAADVRVQKDVQEYPSVDPTAEIDENDIHIPATAVNVGNAQEEDLGSATKVFKFLDNEPEEAEMPEPISSEPQIPDEPEAVVEEISEEPESPKEYSIPDPVDENKAIVPTASATLAVRKKVEDAPAGIGDPILGKPMHKGQEYASYAQRDVFKDRFLDTIMSVRVRFFAAAFVALVLVFVESVFVFGVDIPLIMNLADIPGAMALLDIQFAFSLYLLAVPETLRAIKYLIKGRLVPEIFVTLSFIVMSVYTAVMTVHSPRQYPLFGLLLSISVLSAIAATHFRINAEFAAFKKVSKNGQKLVIDRKLTRTLEHENAALDGCIEEHKSKIARIFRTVFVTDFFKRESKCSENSKSTLFITFASLGAAAVGAGIKYFIPSGDLNGPSSAASAFALIFMLACPAMSILLHKVPYFHASREAELENSAFIGESSFYDYSEIDVVTFDDVEVFGQEDVTLQRIMLYGRSDNLTKALRQMSALFMNIGGPLDVLFSDALDRKCSAAQSVFVEKNGIGGDVDGHDVLAGSLEYMIEKGVRIPEEENASRDPLSASTKVMYAAEDGEVYAKFYIRYSFSEEFSMLLPVLEDYGITPLVYTRDPNVTDELIKILTAGNDKIRVLKQYNADSADSALYRKISAGAVTLGDKNNAINMILLAKRYAALQSRFAITELLSMGVGAALALLLTIGGMAMVPSFALAAWHIIWCGAIHFISRKSFRRKNSNRQ